MKLMKSLSGHTSVSHEGKEYKPNKKGLFEIEDGHVVALKAHGLLLEDEADQTEKANQDAAQRAALEAENAELKRQLADSTLAKENEELKKQLADLQKAK